MKARRRRAPGQSEDQFHRALADVMTMGIAPPGVCSRAGVVWFSHEIRNAGRSVKKADGTVKNFEGAIRKGRGVVSGVPDVQVIWQGVSFWLELKTATGSLSDGQRERHAALVAAGCLVRVVRDVIGAIRTLSEWGIPHRIIFTNTGGAVALNL